MGSGWVVGEWWIGGGYIMDRKWMIMDGLVADRYQMSDG